MKQRTVSNQFIKDLTRRFGRGFKTPPLLPSSNAVEWICHKPGCNPRGPACNGNGGCTDVLQSMLKTFKDKKVGSKERTVPYGSNAPAGEECRDSAVLLDDFSHTMKCASKSLLVLHVIHLHLCLKLTGSEDEYIFTLQSCIRNLLEHDSPLY